MNFKVNEKVVCIDETFVTLPKGLFSSCPIINKVYVVRGAFYHHINFRQLILLVGITGKTNPSGREAAFYSDRFRRLDDIKKENRQNTKKEVDE